MFARKEAPVTVEEVAAEVGALIKAAMLDMDLAISIYLEDLEAERRKAEEEQARSLGMLADALEKVAEGDLQLTIDSSLSAKSEKLVGNFNRAIASLREIIVTVRHSSGRIQSGANEISRASDDLSRRTEQTAASLEETAAALDELTGSVRKAFEDARKANSTVTTTRGEAEQSRDIVNQAVAAMEQIEASSREISSIIGVIDEIAFQTNLLALNAGVEAAREIKELISASSEHVGSGVKLVGDTGEALIRIVTAFGGIGEMVSQMSEAAEAQASGIAEINSARDAGRPGRQAVEHFAAGRNRLASHNAAKETKPEQRDCVRQNARNSGRGSRRRPGRHGERRRAAAAMSPHVRSRRRP